MRPRAVGPHMRVSVIRIATLVIVHMVEFAKLEIKMRVK